MGFAFRYAGGGYCGFELGWCLEAWEDDDPLMTMIVTVVCCLDWVGMGSG